MKLTKLRIIGFKTFVEPADFLIEPGLTGVVGPNGCGKSNLVEALRWVMGESSSKNMRASGMEDVIFSGNGNRPSRNNAEVILFLDNKDRSAPASFNDCDAIEVSRRIEREAGSTYRINAREVRAKDVQLLFADSSTGARSAAMVRQGQIGEIIAAKPQERRRILEEAAGISGLHSRRHEAELRLKAAEENLKRLEDILRQIDGQAESLKKQARQAGRYRTLAQDIRRNEALLVLIQKKIAEEVLEAAELRLMEGLRNLAQETLAQAETARLQAVIAHELPTRRQAEAEASATLHRLVLAREALDGEERRTKSRMEELRRQVSQNGTDIEREKTLIEDASNVLSRLEAEAGELTNNGRADIDLGAARELLSNAEAKLAQSEKHFAEAQDQRSAIEARRAALKTVIEDETTNTARFQAEAEKISQERGALSGASALVDLAGLDETLDGALRATRAQEEAVSRAEKQHSEARAHELEARGPLMNAERRAHALETEIATLSKLLNSAAGGFWPAVTEDMTVAKGYEAAVGAALGDDLDASTNLSSPAHWAATESAGDPALPPGVEALVNRVTAPVPLRRRLRQIGIVLRTEGAALRSLLKPGQRLVSKEGDLWRWDGYTQAAEAPTASARRLSEKNRLSELAAEVEAARALVCDERAKAARAQSGLSSAAAAESQERLKHKTAMAVLDKAREEKLAAERRLSETAARLSALEEAALRIAAAGAESTKKRADAENALDEFGASGELSERLERAHAVLVEDRAAAAEARAALQGFLRDQEARAQRLARLGEEQRSWAARHEETSRQISALQARHAEALEELEKLLAAPDTFFATRQALQGQTHDAESALRSASDGRAAAENALAEADRATRGALEAMSVAREGKARSEALAEAARARCDEIAHMITVELGCGEEELFERAGIKPGGDFPPLEAVEKRLEALKNDRERLGGVNLRAEEELDEILASSDKLSAEGADLTEAIRRLRQAIHNLNKEGRERLLAAFDAVQKHFQDLFAMLFGGGSAELQLLDSEDPLEAGLELIARPPGKKPQVMTLLSGGEQALTAMSLIFAIFLTNPAPVCVLDEVDAPLDDANVDRFCDLLDTMSAKTETRFITVTHNPITMARMNRLFGVTMAERGVSQLVSVDLEEAERFREAS
ncbi:MAG TPA: AAA family ATPase [Methylocella sp.]|nr:AAA family ATPase [Methylocella sp.]